MMVEFDGFNQSVGVGGWRYGVIVLFCVVEDALAGRILISHSVKVG
jgi:hypothetical protein